MTLYLTPEQYAQKKAALLKLNGTDGMTVTFNCDDACDITTRDVRLTGDYDTAGKVLDIEVIATYSFLARHCSASTVEAHVRDMFAKL